MEYIYRLSGASTSLTALIYTLILFMSVIIIGWLVNVIEGIFMTIMARYTGVKASYIAANYLTFPGTIIHELSHALFGLITGAKVTEIRFFEKPSSGRLGHVTYSPRGKIAIRAFQNTAISCAPVVTGLLIVSRLHVLITEYALTVPAKALIFYLMISVVCHMSMSKEDIKNYLRGAFILLPLTWIILLLVLTYAR